jgi:hypothetical protein
MAAKTPTPKKLSNSQTGLTQSNLVQQALTEFDIAVENTCSKFSEMVKYVGQFRETKCDNLKIYMFDLVKYWCSNIIKILIR